MDDAAASLTGVPLLCEFAPIRCRRLLELSEGGYVETSTGRIKVVGSFDDVARTVVGMLQVARLMVVMMLIKLSITVRVGVRLGAAPMIGVGCHLPRYLRERGGAVGGDEGGQRLAYWLRLPQQ